MEVPLDSTKPVHRCGWFCFHPRCLQRLNRVQVFVFSLCMACFFQGTLCTGISNSAFTTLERRYGFSSTQVALFRCICLSKMLNTIQTHNSNIIYFLISLYYNLFRFVLSFLSSSKTQLRWLLLFTAALSPFIVFSFLLSSRSHPFDIVILHQRHPPPM